MASPSLPTVAILGGGITGLSAAFHLSRRLPPATRIILLERERRLGGWIRSEKKNELAPRGRHVVLDAGPRTLRPNSKALLELINLLKLNDAVVTVSKSHPAARSRFIYAPPLTALPSSLLSVLSSPSTPALRPFLPAILREPFRRANRPDNLTDESVDAFVRRRFGPEFARLFVSALVHGIYATDSRQLSVRAAFPSLWDAEDRGWGSVVRGFARSAATPSTKDGQSETDYNLGNMEEVMKDASIYTFEDGMETLPLAIRDWLQTRPNVDVHSGVEVRSIIPRPKEREFQILTSAGPLISNPTHIVSALPLPLLDRAIPQEYALPHLAANPSSTVQVLNVVFSPSPKPLHPPGFGYLVPRPKGGYSTADEPSHYIIGTIFHSGLLPPSANPSDLPTTLTIMLRSPFPVESTSIPAILRTVGFHLGTPLPEPIYADIQTQRNCIPTYTVGHRRRMEELKVVLKQDPWGGRMEVIGAGVGGVSIGDCVEAGRNAGRDWGLTM